MKVQQLSRAIIYKNILNVRIYALRNKLHSVKYEEVTNGPDHLSIELSLAHLTKLELSFVHLTCLKFKDLIGLHPSAISFRLGSCTLILAIVDTIDCCSFMCFIEQNVLGNEHNQVREPGYVQSQIQCTIDNNCRHL